MTHCRLIAFSPAEKRPLCSGPLFRPSQKFGRVIFWTNGAFIGTGHLWRKTLFVKLFRQCRKFPPWSFSRFVCRIGSRPSSRRVNTRCVVLMDGQYKNLPGCQMSSRNCWSISFRRPKSLRHGLSNFPRGFRFSFAKPMTFAWIGPSSDRPAQMMMHARSISKPLVYPCLSTRAIWTFLSDLIAQKVAAKAPLAGLVLDITKCFNILDRGLLKARLSAGFGPFALPVGENFGRLSCWSIGSLSSCRLGNWAQTSPIVAGRPLVNATSGQPPDLAVCRSCTACQVPCFGKLVCCWRVFFHMPCCWGFICAQDCPSALAFWDSQGN